jgi:hypothetical protein
MSLTVVQGTTVLVGRRLEMSAVLSEEINKDQRAGLDRESAEAVEVLREVWSASGQSRADLEEAFGSQKSCQRMQDVGFDDIGGGGDIRSAWRAALERDGKLDRSGGTVRDLVFGPKDSSR